MFSRWGGAGILVVVFVTCAMAEPPGDSSPGGRPVYPSTPQFGQRAEQNRLRMEAANLDMEYRRLSRQVQWITNEGRAINEEIRAINREATAVANAVRRFRCHKGFTFRGCLNAPPVCPETRQMQSWLAGRTEQLKRKARRLQQRRSRWDSLRQRCIMDTNVYKQRQQRLQDDARIYNNKYGVRPSRPYGSPDSMEEIRKRAAEENSGGPRN